MSAKFTTWQTANHATKTHNPQKMKTVKTQQIIGSISHGTMREEDLIPCFLDTIAEFDKARSQSLTEEYESIDTDDELDEFDKEDAKSEFLNETLFDTLNEYAPPYFYFGAHIGDGSDYGFWLIEDFEQQFEDNGGLRVSDTSEVPADYSGEVLHVSDLTAQPCCSPTKHQSRRTKTANSIARPRNGR